MKKLILIGAGGHCKTVIEIIQQNKDFEICGILDKSDVQQALFGINILGTDDLIEELIQKEYVFHITVGQLSSNLTRVTIYNKVKKLGGHLVHIISSKAFVSNYAELGQGIFVGHNAVVNTGAKIGDNTLINTASIIEHDSIVGEHCHIATQAIVNADCIVESNCFLSSNVVVNRGLKIRNNISVGSGSVVTKDLMIENGLYIGVPAILKKELKL
jgi:sugar O-acyltransferase (sialic acid O-acetyltransferase NeuD family)